MKAKLISVEYRQDRHDGPIETLPAGTVIDHPQAWQLVQYGSAIPADDECRERAYRDRTEEQLQAARESQERMREGLQPLTEEDDVE